MTDAVLSISSQTRGGLRTNVRFFSVLLLAFSVSLPMAWISLSKLLLFVICLFLLLGRYHLLHLDVKRLQSMTFFVPVIAALALFMVSLLWSAAPLEVALASLVKHARLLVMVLLVLMLRNAGESRWALLGFSAGLALQLLFSWLSAAGIDLPWQTTWRPRGVVFTSYLDQSIMFSASAAVWWHLSPAKTWPRWAILCLVLATLANVLLLLDGRTGYLIALTLITLAAIWHTPQRLRWYAFALMPVLTLSVLLATSSNFQARLVLIGTELKATSYQTDTSTSTGWRLNAWHRSVQAIEEAPFLGHGVGSFTETAKRLQGVNAEAVFGAGSLSNPHQEFLLWGVEMGGVGILLLLAMFICLWTDFNRMAIPIQRAGFSALTALVIACSFNSTLYDGLIGDFFVTLLGLLLAHGSLTKPAKDS